MRFRALGCLAFFWVFWAFTGPAMACRYQAEPLEASLARAQQAFIGTVRSVENGLAVLSVEQAIRGVKEGDTVEAVNGGSSCDIRFVAGERWFYLGSGHPSGSLLLQDENGVEIKETLDAVTAALHAPPAARGGMVIGGTLERSCAPWDGAAYMITLDNGITAHVYDSIAERDNTSTAVFQADGKPERGHGQILDCMNNKGCRPRAGTITMGAVDDKTAHGRIDVKDGEHCTRHVFKVKRVRKQVFCG